MKQRYYAKYLLITALLLLLTACSKSDQKVIFVNADAAGGDGTSWEEAFTDLQAAIDKAVPGFEVWVASGTYIPTRHVGGDGERKKSFHLKNFFPEGDFTGNNAAGPGNISFNDFPFVRGEYL